jgi:alanine-alpha-ketoisovalerate/valine-pyruvate aminotransferase
MKKIADYRKLLGVDKNVTLKELKSIYRDFMKEFHPDKFQNDEAKKLEAEEKSKDIIEAYHFLVSVAAETVALTVEAYNITLNTASLVDIHYKAQVLQLDFSDGTSYEYFNVPYNMYNKLCNADSKGRFVRRHISEAFVYRSTSRIAAV